VTGPEIFAGNIAAPGFRVDFASAITAGRAIFVPYNAGADQLCAESFYVETEYKALRDYQILSKEARRPASVKALDYPGDYEALAEVKSVMPLGDEVKRVIVNVEAGEARLILITEEIGEKVPEVGDVVHFRLVELSLWDENI
jgi:hypothetical protein